MVQYCPSLVAKLGFSSSYTPHHANVIWTPLLITKDDEVVLMINLLTCENMLGIL